MPTTTPDVGFGRAGWSPQLALAIMAAAVLSDINPWLWLLEVIAVGLGSRAGDTYVLHGHTAASSAVPGSAFALMVFMVACLLRPRRPAPTTRG